MTDQECDFDVRSFNYFLIIEPKYSGRLFSARLSMFAASSNLTPKVGAVSPINVKRCHALKDQMYRSVLERGKPVPTIHSCSNRWTWQHLNMVTAVVLLVVEETFQGVS